MSSTHPIPSTPAGPVGSSAAPPPTARARIATFLDLIKFAHSVFALPFALIATCWASKAVLGRAWPGFGRLGLILACMIFARTLAMTFNRMADIVFDAANPRTAKRPSVTGAVSLRFMEISLVLSMALFAASTAAFQFLYANPWPLMMTIPIFGWLLAYSYTKRFTSLCHFWLGFSLGLAPLSAWLAIAGSFDRDPFLDARVLTIALLSLGVTFWVAGFDILYALQDEAFDRGMHLRSIPAALGRRKALAISRLCHALTFAAFLAVGFAGHFHSLYWIGLGFAAIVLIIEQSLVSVRDISRINLAFMTANGLIGLVFGALAIADTLVLK